MAPLLTPTGWPSHTRNGPATTALVSASILDTDSDFMTGATVEITNASSNDVLSYAPIAGNPITAILQFRDAYPDAVGDRHQGAVRGGGFGAVRYRSWVVTDDAVQTGSGTSLMSVLG